MLEGLYAGAIEDARAREQTLSIRQLERLITEGRKTISAFDALARASHLKVIAEIKRSSPSKGELNSAIDVETLSQSYAAAGASAISVLTEQRGFSGSLDDLREARNAVSLPLLRKDFIANEYQILEARVFGADFVLLIVAGLPAARLVQLKQFAEDLNLEVLVETHSADEIKFAADIGAMLLGINARNLVTFETDPNLFAKLRHLIPAEAIAIAESSVKTREDCLRFREAGADAVLVGEALVTGDAEALIRDFTSV